MLVQYEMVQIQEALRAEAASEQTKIRQVLKFPATRRRMFIAAALGIAAQWSGNAVVSYYLTLVLDGVGITNPTHQSLINGGLQIFNLFATISCGAMLVDKLGRRFLFLWSAMGMAIASSVSIFIFVDGTVGSTLTLDIGSDSIYHTRSIMLICMPIGLDNPQCTLRSHEISSNRLRRDPNAICFLLPLRHRPNTTSLLLPNRDLPLRAQELGCRIHSHLHKWLVDRGPACQPRRAAQHWLEILYLVLLLQSHLLRHSLVRFP